jgi:hypothetical protein
MAVRFEDARDAIGVLPGWKVMTELPNQVKRIQTFSHAGGITSALILARTSGSVTGAAGPR